MPVMPLHTNTTVDLWNRIIERWRHSNIATLRSASPEAIVAFEKKHAVVFPADVRDYFATVNGNGDDMDDEMYRFWPLADVKSVHEVLEDTQQFSSLSILRNWRCANLADSILIGNESS